MARGPAGGLLAFLRRLPPAPDSDADLLARFAAARDGAAFAALVARHGPMVFATCRRVLGESADAEDAFQVVFVALARQAGHIGTRAAVPGWLHRVAVRTARKVLARRRSLEPLPPNTPAAPAPDPADREALAALDDEVNALAEPFRAAVVLCGLEGWSNTEAAALLGCPSGTVDSRLHAARRKLRDRLARRGFAPHAVGATLLAISLDTARAADAAARLSPAVLAAISGGPLSPAMSKLLMEMTTMRTRFQLLAAAVLVLALTGVGFGLLHALAATQPPGNALPGDPFAPATPNAPDAPKPVTDAEYQNALVEAIHHFADDPWGYDNLRAMLARHPELVNERRMGEVRGKPSVTDRYTALHFATRRGNEKAVALLIEYKADVNATDGLDWTPLHIAAQEGNLEIVKLLVKAGAKLDAKTHPLPGGIPPGSPASLPGEPPPKPLPPVPAMTPLDLAKDAKKAEVVKYLERVKP